MTTPPSTEPTTQDRRTHDRDVGTRHRRPGRRRLGAGAAVLALVVGTTACGGDDDSADTTSAVAESTTATSAATTTPPTRSTATTSPATTEASSETTTAGDDAVVAQALTDTLAGQGVDVFLSLVDIIGLDQITTTDQVTLFVPSDDAFTSIQADELASIVEDPTLVRDVLEAHVVEGAVLSSDLSDGDTVEPVSGDTLDVSIDGDTVMIGNATVTQPDILFDGGVIHIIDDILTLPGA